jgi:tRNA dimethylallyltransferase
VGLLSDEVREFVQAFLPDHGGIHVGEKEPLAPPGGGLHHGVDRCVADGLAQAVRREAVVVFAGRGKGDVDGDPRRQPVRLAAGAERPGGAPCQRLEARQGPVGDQGGDVGHDGAEIGDCGCDDTGCGDTGFGMNGADDPVRAVLIAGPTASGKSALALAVAERLGGIVINTDSMQVYRDLANITARPGLADVARAAHLLYGHVDAAENYSVGRFVGDARAALTQARAQSRVAIFTGGSGLYFKALTRGLAAIPPVAAEIRAGVRARLESGGVAALHAELARRDPATAARLNPADRTRIARALEVFEATGRAISDWHRDGLPPLLDPAQVVKVFLAPERAELYRRIDAS